MTHPTLLAGHGDWGGRRERREGGGSMTKPTCWLDRSKMATYYSLRDGPAANKQLILGETMLDQEHDEAKLGYQTAIDLWVYEGTTYWAKFSGMVTSNTIIFGAISLIIAGTDTLVPLKVALCLFGIVLSSLWLFILRRSIDQYKYWILSARELEEVHFANAIRTISRGRDFAEGHQVKFNTNPPSEIQVSSIGRMLRVQQAAESVIGLFGVAYILLLFV